MAACGGFSLVATPQGATPTQPITFWEDSTLSLAAGAPRSLPVTAHDRVPSILHPLYSTLSLHMSPYTLYTPPSAPSLITP